MAYLSTAALDADQLKQNLIAYLKAQDNFKDYDYSGSNISALLDLLIQNTVYNNHYLNMTGAEAFLDTAELRESIISRAKELNYIPKSRSSARAIVSVTISPNDSPNSIVIPKGYVFTTTINNQKYLFTTNQNYSISRNNGTYTISNVEIFEGIIVQEYFDCVSSNVNGYQEYTSRFILNSENVDINSLEVSVTSNNVTTTFTRANSLFGVTNISNCYFIQGYGANGYEIVFGDGILGKALSTGDVVNVSYRDTLGSDGNGISAFSKTNAISGYSSITVVTNTISYGGSERESNSSVKYNSVRHFQTQERAVTEADYKNLLLTNFPEIQSVSVTNGEDVGKYNKVLISVKPSNATIISDTLKDRITKFFKTKNLGIRIEIVNLEYFYIFIDSIVRYNGNATAASANDIKTGIVSNLLNLNTTDTVFKQNVYGSQVSQIITNSNPAITSNTIDIGIVKRLYPSIGNTSSYIIEFNNELKSEGVRYQYPLGHEKIVWSSNYTYILDGVSYTVWFQDNGIGDINLYTTYNGTTVLLSKIGTVDYDVGKLIFDVTASAYTSYISVYARLKYNDVEVTNNKYLLLDSSDFNIQMVDNA